MPTELEELVGFIAHASPTIRLAAVENLVPYSTTDQAIFKTENLKPVNNLKILILDHPKIAEHVLTILVNLSADGLVLSNLAVDDAFLKAVLERIVHPDQLNANLLAMLLANLSKHDSMSRITILRQPPPEKLSSDPLVLNQLVDLFVRGHDGSYNKHANYDYLSYLFADLSKHAPVRTFFSKSQSYDDVVPITKLKVFTEHDSHVRRKGVASTIKNISFEVSAHGDFLDSDRVDMLPYILLPLVSGDDVYDDDESDAMLPDLQLLPPEKARDADGDILQTHLETLCLLTTTLPGRKLMRNIHVYAIVREMHKRIEHEGAMEACDRLVQVLMRDEEPEPKGNIPKGNMIEGAYANGGRAESEEEDDQIVEV